MKKCSKCGEVKPLSEFSKDKYAKDGFVYQCKSCVKAYHEASKEILKAKNKAYYEGNREKIKAKRKAYYEVNKEIVKAKNKAYYEANKQKNKPMKKKEITENQLQILYFLKEFYDRGNWSIGLSSASKEFRFKNRTAVTTTMLKNKILINKGTNTRPCYSWNTIKPNIEMVRKLEEEADKYCKSLAKDNKERNSKKSKIKKVDVHRELKNQLIYDFFIENRETKQFADKFINYYESRNWIQKNGNKVINWKNVARNNWFGRDLSNNYYFSEVDNQKMKDFYNEDLPLTNNESNNDKKMKEQIENILNTNKQQTKEIESLKKLSQEKESNLKELSDKYNELKEKQAKNTVSFLWGLIKITK